MKRKYILQVNDYMTPIRVRLTEEEAMGVAYVLEEIAKSDKHSLIHMEDENGEWLCDNYDEWYETHKNL